MASEHPTDKMLDLLYDELGADEKSERLSELEADDELRVEFESYQQMLSDLDAELPVVEPPSSVHESLMAAAREQVAESVEETARAERRPPRQVESRGFWGKIASSQTGQIALVATVLLVGAFVFKIGGPGMDMAPTPGQMAFEERPQPSFESAEAPAAEVADEPARPAEEYESEEVVAEAEPEPPKFDRHQNAPMAPERDKSRARAEDRQLELGRAEKEKRAVVTDSLKAADSRNDYASEPKPEPKAKPAPRRRTRKAPAKSTASKKTSSRTGTMDLFGSDKKDAPNDKPNIQGKGLEGKSGPAPSAQPAPTTAQAALDSDADGELAKQEQQAYRPPTGTIASVEEYFSSGDYRQTINEADKVLSSSATTTQKARALELKADSYRRMNQLNRADTLYRNLQQNYPEYAPQRVRNARAEIQRILTQKRERPAKKRKAVPEYEFDDASEAMPTAE